MRGYTQALEIMAMENILRELEVDRFGVSTGDFRSQDLYFVSFFGRPSFEETWGWRFLGHHLSLSYTIVGQRWLSVTPCNMGAQPAEMGVLSPLRADEDLGFEILHGLGDAQRKQAIIHDVAPADYTTRQVPRVGKVEYPDYIDLGIDWYKINDEDREALKFEKNNPRGIAGSDMPGDQARNLVDLVESFVGRLPEEVTERYMERVKGDGLEKLWFCWAGGQERGLRTTTGSRVPTSSSSSTTPSTMATTSTRCGATTAPTSATSCCSITTSTNVITGIIWTRG